MRIVKVSQLLDDRERNYLLYNGDVIIFEKIPAILELNGYLDRLVQDVFGGLSKCSMLNECSSKQDSSVFGVNIERLQNRFRKEPAFADLFRSALKQTGMDIERNYADVLFLRCVAPLLKKISTGVELPITGIRGGVTSSSKLIGGVVFILPLMRIHLCFIRSIGIHLLRTVRANGRTVISVKLDPWQSKRAYRI